MIQLICDVCGDKILSENYVVIRMEHSGETFEVHKSREPCCLTLLYSVLNSWNNAHGRWDL